MARRCKCINCGYLYKIRTNPKFLGDRQIGTDWNIPGMGAYKEPVYEYPTELIQISILQRKSAIAIEQNESLHCFRSVSDFKQEVKESTGHNEDENEAMAQIIKKDRDCDYYLPYIAGYGPAQHLAKWENYQRDRVNRVWNLIFLLIGAVIGFLANLAYKLLTS